jgi:hypothetical protein
VSPTAWLAFLVLSLVCLCGGAWLGIEWEQGRQAERDVKVAATHKQALDKAIREGNENAVIDMEAAAKVEHERQAGRIAELERRPRVEKSIETKVVYRDGVCTLDADDLRLWNEPARDLSGSASADAPGDRHGRLPGSSARRGGREHGDAAAQSSGLGRGLRGLPQLAPGAGGLGQARSELREAGQP